MDKVYHDQLLRRLDEVTKNFVAQYDVSNVERVSKLQVPMHTPEDIDSYLKVAFGGFYDGYNELIEEYVKFFTSRPVSQLQLWYTLDKFILNIHGNLTLKPMSMLVFQLTRSQMNYVSFHNDQELLLAHPISLIFGNVKSDFIDKRWDELAHFQMRVQYLEVLLKNLSRASHCIGALVLGAATVSKVESANKKTYWELYPDLDHTQRDFYPAMLAAAFVFEKIFKSRLPILSIKPREEYQVFTSGFPLHLDVLRLHLQIKNESFIQRNGSYFKRIIPSGSTFELPKSVVEHLLENEVEIAFACTQKIHAMKPPMTLVYYVLKDQDTWDRVAVQFNIKKSYLLKINCLSEFNECNASRIFVPVLSRDSAFYAEFNTLGYDSIMERIRGRNSATFEFQPNVAIKEVRNSNQQTYIVRSGDTLTAIARKHRVTIAQIKAWNNLKSDNLQVGQKLVIKK
jgi:LysM repeat protein